MNKPQFFLFHLVFGWFDFDCDALVICNIPTSYYEAKCTILHTNHCIWNPIFFLLQPLIASSPAVLNKTSVEVNQYPTWHSDIVENAINPGESYPASSFYAICHFNIHAIHKKKCFCIWLTPKELATMIVLMTHSLEMQHWGDVCNLLKRAPLLGLKDKSKSQLWLGVCMK